MSIKETLKKYIDDSAVEEILKNERLYDQSDFDNVVAKAKENITNKYNRDYVPKTEHDLLLSDYNNLKKTSQTDKIKQFYLEGKGNEDFFNDFLKLNDDLLNSENITKDAVTQRLYNHSGALNESIPVPGASEDNTPDFNIDTSGNYNSIYEFEYKGKK